MIQYRFLLAVLLTVIVKVVSAQDRMVHGTTPDLYLQHIVEPKENWYSIGRNFNLPPKEIAAFNGATIERPLSVRELIKIPLKTDNFLQTGSPASDDLLIPVYHTVQDREWMYRISVNHNKVPIDLLEKWNQITHDQAKPGMNLIVGYLKVKKGVSALVPGNTPNTGLAARPTANPGTSRTTGQTAVNNPPVATRTTATPAPATTPARNTPPGESYFRGQYEDQGKNLNGSAGIFRSTSGWNDGKFYALMNNVTVGTIIRITHPQTNKSVYAKVLGELPDMKESAGLTLRMSDAAAKELGETGNKFGVAISY